MNWPTSQDYNEAIQNAASSFRDPALKSGEVVVNALGLPVPRSGNFADVYQFQGGDGKMWAVKCFTRKVSGLQERYTKIDEHLTKAKLPFTVGFNYFEQGIRVRGQWFPLLKMEWVEGLTLNEFVRDNAGKPQYLHALMTMWTKLSARLRDCNVAHADLQHGNVLLVPATSGTKLGLKLIDYDGIWVPALADKHSGEVGHPNFQHPLRLKERLYNADVDRFPQLVIASALRATLIGGKDLWDRFDNGDNLLFKEGDLKDLPNSAVFKALWELKDDILCALLGKMTLAAREPLRKTPWLDDLLLAPDGARLSNDEERKIIDLSGVSPHFTASNEAAQGHLHVQQEFNVFGFSGDDTAEKPRVRTPAERTQKLEKAKPAAKSKSKMPYYVGGGVVMAALLFGIIILATGGNKNPPLDTPKDELAKAAPAKQDDKSRSFKKDNSGATKVDEPAKTDPPPKKNPTKDVPDDMPKIEPPADPPKKGSPVEAPKKNPESVAKQAPLEVPKPPRDDIDITLLWKSSTSGIPAFSVDGSKLHISSLGEMWLSPVQSGPSFTSNRVASKPFVHYEVAPDGSYLIGQGADLICWDPKTKAIRFTVAERGYYYYWFAAAFKGKVMMLSHENGSVGVFSLSDGKLLERIELPGGRKKKPQVSCTDDGEAILAYAGPTNVLFRPNKGAPFHRLAPMELIPADPIVKLAPDAKHFLTIKRDANVIEIYETTNGNKRFDLKGHPNFVMNAVFVANGQRLVSFDIGAMLIWDLESGQQIGRIDFSEKIQQSAVSRDGRSAATVSYEPRQVQVWRLSDRKN